jgi:hypothetical protein
MSDCPANTTRNNFASRLLSKAINDRIKKGPFPREVTPADAAKFAVAESETKEPVVAEA